MLIKNTQDRYGAGAILIHWLMAVLVMGLLALGLYMTRLPVSVEKLILYGRHKSVGIVVLILLFVRILWRVSNITPSLPSAMPNWEKFAARAVHWAFYGFLLAMPISGWLMSSAAGRPVSFFGWFILPDMIHPDEKMRIILTQIHHWLAYGLIFTLCLHTAAALKHHFIDKDDVLMRILR